MKHLTLLLLLGGALANTACFHTNAVLPGVLDLRSDGSSAAPAKDKPKLNEEVSRDGLGGILKGDGLQVQGDKVTIEDRNWHLLELVHIVNDHGEAEFAALPKDGALKNVTVGDSMSGEDVIITIVSSIIPCWNITNVAPHITLSMQGTRIAGQGAAVAEPPPPTDGTAPAAPPAAEPAPLAPEKK